MDLQYKSEFSSLVSEVKSAATYLLCAANDYAAGFEKKLLSFDFSPIDPKQCAMDYYDLIDRVDSKLECLASISESASTLYSEHMEMLEQINASGSSKRIKIDQEAIQKARAELIDIQNILALTAKISDICARFTKESEPLIMQASPSAKEIGAVAKKYALALSVAIEHTQL